MKHQYPKLTRRQLVLLELLQARNGKVYRYNNHVEIPKGWVPSWVLVSPAVGGIGGLRRVRELRARGLDIEVRTFYYQNKQGDPVRTATTIYKLNTHGKEIDFERTCRMGYVPPKPKKEKEATYGNC